MQTATSRANGPGRVLLVDDHPAVRRVLRSMLEEVGGWEVVGEAETGEAAVSLVEKVAPDVVLMDCRMPGQGGVAATREIVRRWPEVAVVAHTAYSDETYVREMVAAGARGYVLKGDVPAAVLEALSAAMQGQARLSAAVTGPVMGTCGRCTRRRWSAPASWRPRTPPSPPRWPGWRRSTGSRTSSWRWSATSCARRSR
jgi:DNA-binding NarL/FixJ family response regulator